MVDSIRINNSNNTITAIVTINFNSDVLPVSDVTCMCVHCNLRLIFYASLSSRKWPAGYNLDKFTLFYVYYQLILQN